MGAVDRLFGALVRRRKSLPAPVRRMMDSVARNPDGLAARIAGAMLGGGGRANLPLPTAAPDLPVRVYIGATNYSGQGYRWARALEASSPQIGARNMAIEIPGGFAFPADSSVPITTVNRSLPWQEAEFAAVAQFTHVLIEAERPLFGALFGRDVELEIAEMTARGLSVAFIAHGTDVRSPRKHMLATPWSYFADDAEETAVLQRDADQSIAVIERTGLPVFVSTPDLLVDVPRATWCPVVVEADHWTSASPVLTARIPVVAHVPSVGPNKGTHLIEPVLRRMAAAGFIDYRPISGVPSADMPSIIGRADIVLDQFRAGSYGVAACEAMAAGRLVIGHVLPEVRAHVLAATGLTLPIVEANPDTLEATLLRLMSDPRSSAAIAADGPAFVRAVHSGRMSALALRDHWIGR